MGRAIRYISITYINKSAPPHFSLFTIATIYLVLNIIRRLFDFFVIFAKIFYYHLTQLKHNHE